MATDVSLDEARESAAEARAGDALRENDAGVPNDMLVDYEEHDVPSCVLNPEALVTFDHIAGIGINMYGQDDFLDREQNLEGAGPQGYGFDIAITVAEPEVAEGELWKEAGDDEFTTYRVLGDPSADESPYDVNYDSNGDPQGVDLGMGGFEGERVDDELPSYVQIEVSSRRAVSVLGALDTAGRWSHSQDGELIEGIIEMPPEDLEDANPRAIGFPELRADMVGESGAIAYTFDDDAEEITTQTFVQVDLFKVTDDGLEALTPLSPEDDTYALPTYPRGNNLQWADHEGPEDIEGDTVDEATTDIGFGSNGSSEDGFTFETLDEQDKEYVREAVTFLDDKDSDDLRDVLEDFETTYEGQIDGGEATGDVPAQEMADIVQQQA